MQVKQINLNDDEMPEAVLVRMTHDEAVYLTLLIGKQNGAAMEQVMPGGAVLGGAVYEALTGGLFNRFYEDGVNDAAAAAGARQ